MEPGGGAAGRGRGVSARDSVQRTRCGRQYSAPHRADRKCEQISLTTVGPTDVLAKGEVSHAEVSREKARVAREPRGGGSREKAGVAREPRGGAHEGSRGRSRCAKCRVRRIAHVSYGSWRARERVSEESNRHVRHEANDHVRHERQVSNRHELTCEKGEKCECRTCRFDASLMWRTSFFWWLHGPDVSNFRPYVSQVSRLASKLATCVPAPSPRPFPAWVVGRPRARMSPHGSRCRGIEPPPMRRPSAPPVHRQTQGCE
jgi:hypothetical protein